MYRRVQRRQIMLEEQKLFDAKKKEVARLDEIEKGRPLTFEERENRDKIKMILFEKVEKYGIQLMNAKIRNCDAKQDIRQD